MTAQYIAPSRCICGSFPTLEHYMARGFSYAKCPSCCRQSNHYTWAGKTCDRETVRAVVEDWNEMVRNEPQDASEDD